MNTSDLGSLIQIIYFYLIFVKEVLNALGLTKLQIFMKLSLCRFLSQVASERT